MTDLTAEQKAAQDAARIHGRFGPQNTRKPEASLPADTAGNMETSSREADVMLRSLAERIGEDLWDEHRNAAVEGFREANPGVPVPGDVLARAAGNFLIAGRLHTPARVKSWLNSAYQKGLTGFSGVRLGPDGNPVQVISDAELAGVVRDAFDGTTDLEQGLADGPVTTGHLRVLIAGAHALGAARKAEASA